jgi:hypothetical protein
MGDPGAYFWVDEWIWIVNRGDFSTSAFLEPHNQHLSLVPVAIYRALSRQSGSSITGRTGWCW